MRAIERGTLYREPDGNLSSKFIPGALEYHETRFPGDNYSGFTIAAPQDWDPFKASAEERQLAAFPEQPADEAPTEQKQAWLKTVANWKRPTFVGGGCRYVGLSAGLLPNIDDPSGGSNGAAWVGTVDTFASSAFTSADGKFVQPSFVSQCTSSSYHTIWTGVGGRLPGGGSGSSLVQVGTSASMSGANGTSTGFWEMLLSTPGGLLDSNVQTFPGFSVAPGDSVEAKVYYTDGNPYPSAGPNSTWTMQIINLTTGANISQSFYNPFSYPAQAFNRQSAEYIHEPPIQNGSPLPFRRTAAPTFWKSMQTNNTPAGDFPLAYRSRGKSPGGTAYGFASAHGDSSSNNIGNQMDFNWSSCS
ncbi:MAG: G1 family glutamic endopeptidase [Acidimicrobiales bacterium]